MGIKFEPPEELKADNKVGIRALRRGDYKYLISQLKENELLFGKCFNGSYHDAEAILSEGTFIYNEECYKSGYFLEWELFAVPNNCENIY